MERAVLIPPTATSWTKKREYESMAFTVEYFTRICKSSISKMGAKPNYPFIDKIANIQNHPVAEHAKISVIIHCSRWASHQIVRHRLCSFCQESTRYVNYKTAYAFTLPRGILPGIYDKRVKPIRLVYDPEDQTILVEKKSTIVVPLSQYLHERFRLNDSDLVAACLSIDSIMRSLWSYNRLRELGKSLEDARYVLAGASKTTVGMTANVREWRHIFNTRVSRHAEFEIKYIMNTLLQIFKEYFPVFFQDMEALNL